MIILFGFAYPSSSFIARYLRHKLWWKQAHQKVGSLGLMTSLTSAYFAISTTAPGKYSTHGLLGIGCVILLCVQFAGGFGVGYWFEHWKRNKWYNKLHYTHLGLAISLNFAAPVTMWYGWLRLQPYHVPVLQYAPVWFSYFALLIIVGEIYKRYYPKWSKNSEYSAFESNYHVFTWDEIGEKVSAGAAWIIIDKYVLDVTLFYLSHPGGRKILLDHTGTDCSQYFHGSKPMDGLQKYAHSEWAKKQMARMIVGEIPSQTQNVIGRISFRNRNLSRYGSSTKAEVAINDEDSDEETDNAFDHNKLDAFLESYEIDELVDLIDNITDDEGSDDDGDANRNRIISKQTLLKHKAKGLTVADLAKKTQKVSEAKRFRIVKLLSKTKMSAADCSRPIFLLEFDIDAQTKFCAGDYILLHDTGKETVTRAYTPINPGFILCDNGTPLQNEREAAKNKKKNCAKCFVRKPKPTEGGRLFLLVRLYKKGRMSSIISSLNINSSLRLTGPFERQQLLSPINFGFGRQCWRRVILICGGTGITPMINALFHHLKYGTDKCRVLLIWYNRTISDVVCIDHLKYFKESYAKRFWIDLIFSAYQKNTNECIERELLQFTTIHDEKWNKKQALSRIRSFLIDGHGISRMRSFITNKLSKQTTTRKRLGELGIPDTESRDQTEDEDESLSLQTDIDVTVTETKTNVDTQEVSLSSADEDILENICCEIVGDVEEGSEIVQSNENDAKDDIDIGVDAKKRILSNSRTFEDNGENKDEHDDIKGDVNININVGMDMQRRYDDDNGIETVHLSPFDRIIFSGPKRFVEEFLEWLKSADDYCLNLVGNK